MTKPPSSLPIKSYGLPGYIHYGNERGFLCASCDVFGKWMAGYHVWREDLMESGCGDYSHTYTIVGPSVGDHDSIEEAFAALAPLVREYNREDS